jgi:(E)-4-hydroxy-3-methylbut-2-enyl-diphosphate synthase
MISQKIDYPLHIGITEAGLKEYGTVKSAIGLGILLYDGIGDTLRVSLTADPVHEVTVAWDILKALEIRRRDPEIISCPTCARSEIDVITLAGEVNDRVKHLKYPLRLAVMGCAVNGPGEAKEADLGIAGGRGNAVIFREGSTIIKDIRESDMLRLFMEEIEKFIKEKF